VDVEFIPLKELKSIIQIHLLNSDLYRPKTVSNHHLKVEKIILSRNQDGLLIRVLKKGTTLIKA
jgi:hypothetical protein